MVYDLSNRRDNCCSTAKSAFCEIFYFVQIYFTFFDFQSEIMFCNIYQRTACDGWKNTIGLRCYNGVVLCNEDEVCSTCLFNFCSCSRIKIHIFVITLTMCIHNCMKAHCIVQTCFDVSCSMRCGTVKICNTDRDRFCAALEIRSNRCSKDTELIFISRFYTDNRVASEHVRTYIKCCT